MQPAQTKNLFEDVSIFPDFDDFSFERFKSNLPKGSSIADVVVKDNTDMNNLYESSESNDENHYRTRRNQTKLTNLTSSMLERNKESKSNNNGDENEQLSYEDYGESSDDEDDEDSDDSAGPKKILVKIRPIDELDRTNATNPDVLNQISKNLKLKIENSEKIKVIKRKTYTRKIRSSLKTEDEVASAQVNFFSSINSQKQPELNKTLVGDDEKPHSSSLFDFKFDSPSNMDENNNRLVSKQESQRAPPPLPPLPVDFKIYEKLNAIKNRNDNGLVSTSLNAAANQSSCYSFMPSSSLTVSDVKALAAEVTLASSYNFDLEPNSGNGASLYDTANSNDEMTF